MLRNWAKIGIFSLPTKKKRIIVSKNPLFIQKLITFA